MTSIAHIHTTVGSAVGTNNTTFTEVVESDALVSGKTYYVLCHALTEGGLTHETDSFRLVDRTNTDTVLSNSTMIREPNTANSTQSYYFLGRFTAGSGGGGLAFEQKSSNSGFTVRTQYLSMMLLDLENMGSGDFFFANNAVDTELTSSLVAFATESPNTNSGDEWLVFGWQATATDVINASSTEVQLFSDVDSDDPTSLMEGEDLTEVLNVLQARTYTVGSSNTWSMKSRYTLAPSTPNNHLESTMLGIRLNAFKDYASVFTPAELTTASTDFQEYATVSFDPDASDDVLVFGSALFNGQATSRPCLQRIQIDGVTSPNTQPDSEHAGNTNDGTDVLPLSFLTTYTPSGSSKVIDMDCKKTTSSLIGFSSRSLCAFTTALTDPPIYGSVASQIYNEGDVVSDVFTSGDVATEIN